ncbi:MAG TPA: LLM class F420-dependent oxidoreductase [Candidatus Binatia bacterium]|nr:LLM class F420-dependent oxidoreductase [Candidatus Binatia bacterium]
MKFGILFANAGPFGTRDGLGALARHAEAAGIESLWTVEHVAVPVGYESRYPYSPSGKMPGPEDSPIPDPVLPLAYAAAVTERIRLGTGVLILPQRHPLYVAKEFATLDVLSNGRAMLGIGIGWLAEEFAAVGVPFEERAGRTREAVKAIRQLWSDGARPFEGKYFRWPALESNPKPVQKPGVPIVVGGHTEIAARRAARYGDGFFPAIADVSQLSALLAIVRDECAKIGRDPGDVEVTAGAGFVDADQARRLRDAGAARIAIAPPAFDPAALPAAFADFNERVASKL